MSHILTAHRTEQVLLEIDMAEEVPEGVSGVSSAVVIFDCGDRNPYHDCRVAGCNVVTDELLDSSAVLVGESIVQFTKRAATDATEQLRDFYRIECTLTLNDGETVTAQSERQRLPLLRIYR